MTRDDDVWNLEEAVRRQRDALVALSATVVRLERANGDAVRRLALLEATQTRLSGQPFVFCAAQ